MDSRVIAACGRVLRCFRKLGALMALGIAAAHAAPPSVNQGAITVPLPRVGETIVINLRQLGVVSGTAPLSVGPSRLRVLLDGIDASSIWAVFPLDVSDANVCVQIGNIDALIGQGRFELDGLVVTNPKQQTASGTIPIVFGPGPTVNLQDPQQYAACLDPNNPPIANAGTDQTVQDVGAPGEVVTLSGSASSDPEGDLLTYQWFSSQSQTPLSTSVTFTQTLQPGSYQFRLVATDEAGNSSQDTVNVTVNAANAAPTVSLGADRTIADTNGLAGEPVTIAATASDDDGTIASYAWTVNGTLVQGANTATLSTTLPDGQNTVALTVTDNGGATANDSATITVIAPGMPIANAGTDQTLADTDRQPGEVVNLNGSGSSAPNGTIQTYQWSVVSGETERALGNGVALSIRLPDGTNQVVLRVTDALGRSASDTVAIAINAPAARESLASLPNLSPNKKAMATALDRICDELDSLTNNGANLNALSQDQRALMQRCDGLYFNNTNNNKSRALAELGADDFSAARTQTLLFSNTLYSSVMDRLVALRGGARGLSLAGLNIIIDGKPVPLAQLQDMGKKLLGGGASSDADNMGLLSDRWGVWARGNYATGQKDKTLAAPSFDAKQWAFVGGLDYRLSDNMVLGSSAAYGKSTLNFNPNGQGGLDTKSWALSVYGSTYAAKNFYFDAILNLANSGYDADRNITYVDGTGLVSADATGSTNGKTWSSGLSGGYDLLFGRLTISPNVGLFYIKAQIDQFAEKGAAGLNLVYEEQNFKSFTGNMGVRLTLPWNLSWGVILPHLRVDYVREFETDVDVFGVRFAADPDVNSTPPILVRTENPDPSYWRLAGGLSAQFRFGISAYVEYQRLAGFESIAFQDVSFGLRAQKSF
jgi:uncharacterized protein YhjY with autotransporter beta-barrel domain